MSSQINDIMIIDHKALILSYYIAWVYLKLNIQLNQLEITIVQSAYEM